MKEYKFKPGDIIKGIPPFGRTLYVVEMPNHNHVNDYLVRDGADTGKYPFPALEERYEIVENGVQLMLECL
jgi:hypothetical protein